MQDRRSDISQTAVLNRCRVIVRNIDKRNGVQRVSRIRCSIWVDGIVGIAMIGNDDSLVACSLGSLDDFTYTVVNSPYRFGNCIVDTCMANHITIGEVDNDEVVFVFLDGSNEFVFDLIGTHLRLQVVGSHLRTRYQDAVLTLEWFLTSTVEEEGYVCIFLGLCRMQLLFALT